jgi:uncharacterized membrane protein YdjX (TVP38/TMEM64 family)
MSKWRVLMILVIILGLAFIALGVYYWVTPAGSLPSFFPGHLAGSVHKHVKHGVAALFVGVLCLLGAWMFSAKK